MSRERLTSRVAEDMKSKPGAQVEAKGSGEDNDAYNMNDTGHKKNNPDVGEYAKGDPSAWAEGVAPKNWASQDAGGEKRNDMNVPDLIDKHAATEAVATVKALEKKAVKCMVASQRMLPGASDEVIVKQAIDLMNLPEEAVNATLARQEALANSMKTAAKGKDDKDDDDEEEEASKKILADKQAQLEALKKQAADLEKEVEAGQNDPKYFYGNGQKVKDVQAGAKKKDEDEEACVKDAAKKEEEEEEAGSKEAKKKEDDEEEAGSKEAKKKEDDEEEAGSKEAKKEDEEEAESKEAKKEEEEEEEEEAESKEASLLDTIFSAVIASDDKKGATKLSGMVKKASTDGDTLSKLWKTDPDVSSVFQ